MSSAQEFEDRKEVAVVSVLPVVCAHAPPRASSLLYGTSPAALPPPLLIPTPHPAVGGTPPPPRPPHCHPVARRGSPSPPRPSPVSFSAPGSQSASGTAAASPPRPGEVCVPGQNEETGDGAEISAERVNDGELALIERRAWPSTPPVSFHSDLDFGLTPSLAFHSSRLLPFRS